MTRFLAALICNFLICTASHAETLHVKNDYWQRLLHFDGAQSRVVSEEFFLSANGQNDPAGEQIETIRLLNEAHGLDIACNFPARYRWLQSQGKNVPNFDLNQCVELQEFLRNFQRETLSIIFVSEFVDVPASAFGHIMLVFHNHDTPLPLADAIHFSAVTERDSFFRYAYRGLAGKYDGFFIREPLFVKQNEYNVHEQRALHFYELNFSAEEISRITLHLYELRKARFHYYFITENCAFHIGQLLNIALQGEDRGFENASVVLPIDIVRKYADRITERRVLAPSLLHAEELLNKFTTDEQRSVKNIIGQRESPLNALPDNVKEILALHYQYAFRRQRVVYENFDEVQSLRYSPSSFTTSIKDPLTNDESSRALIGVYQSKSLAGVLLGYRPMLRDIYALQQDSLQESELSLLDFQMLAYSNGIRLEQLDLIKIRSLPKRNILRQDLAWNFYTGANRGNVNQEIRPEIEFGLGESFGSHHFTLNGSVSAGLQGNTGVAAYLKPSISLIGYLPANIKYGIQISDERFQHEHYLQNEIFFSNAIGKGYVVMRLIQASPSEPLFTASYSLSI